MKNLTKEEKLLIIIITIYSFLGSLSGVFLQIFFFKLGGFESVFFFNLIVFILVFFTYIFSGNILKKYSTKNLINISLVFSLVGYGILLYLGHRSVNHLIFFGIIFGVANGLFWSGYNLSQYILTHKSSRNHYFGTGNMTMGLGSIVAPALAGFIIILGRDFYNSLYSGYYLLFLTVFFINLILLFFTLKLPHHSNIKFNLKDIIKIDKKSPWRYVLSHQFVNGLYDSSLSVIFSLILLTVLVTENKIGIARAFLSLLVALVSFYAGKQLLKNNSLYKVGVWGTFIAVLILGLFINLPGLFLAILIMGLTNPYLSVSVSSAILNGIDDDKKPWQQKYHYLIQRDAVLGLARSLSFFFLYILTITIKLVNIMSIWLMIISVFPLLVGYFLKKQYQHR